MMLREQFDDLSALLERLIDGEFSAGDRTRLNALLLEHEDARRYYRGYMRMHYGLEWRIGEPGIRSATRGIADLASTPSLPAPIPAAAPRRIPTIGYALPIHVSAGALLSYAFAALLLCVGILAVRAWTLPSGRQVADEAAPPPDVVAVGNSEPAGAKPYSGPVVARVTGVADCRWTDPGDAAKLGALVPLGRKYSLLSGRLELTYILGAKVTVRGPAEYEVDSANSGFLSRGKIGFSVDPAGWNFHEGETVVVDTGSADWPAERVVAPGRYRAGHCPTRFLVATPNKTFVINRDGRFIFGVDPRGAVQTWLKEGSIELICRNGLDLPTAIGASGKFWGFVDKDAHDRVIRLVCTAGEPPVSVLLAFSNRRTSLNGDTKSAGGPLWFENERGKKNAEEALNIMGLE